MTDSPENKRKLAVEASSANPFQDVKMCHSAEELLDKLSPRRGDLRDHPLHDWIFRGQADAKWGLTPSALRPGTLVHFPSRPPKGYEYRLPPDTQLQYEQRWVNRFIRDVDYHGLKVPGDRPDLRDGGLPTGGDAYRFPPVERRPMFALAQHYGIPTRLLDWTRTPLTAAYFACVGVVRDQAEGKATPDKFAIWALSRTNVENINRPDDGMPESLRVKVDGDFTIAIVTVPTVSNPNLRAQQGLFTLVEHFPDSQDPDRPQPFSGFDATPPLDELIRDRVQANQLPVLWKWSLPSSEAGELLRLLAMENVTGATVFHGHDAVMRGIREEEWLRVTIQGGR